MLTNIAGNQPSEAEPQRRLSLAEMIDLRGDVAVVTGAAQGFGFACADRLSEAGAAVLLSDVRIDRLEAARQRLERLGRRVSAQVADISQKEAVDRLMDVAIERFGKVSVLINNAGVFSNVLFENLSQDEFMRILHVNALGSFLCIQAAAARMREQGGGSIVNISSIDAVRPSAPGLAHYDASKHAIWGLTKSAAIEYGPLGIRVNAIAPGSSFTEGAREFLEAGAPVGHDIAAQWGALAKRTPLKRTLEPDEIGRVALFLSSRLAEFINGAQIVVDGGFLQT